MLAHKEGNAGSKIEGLMATRTIAKSPEAWPMPFKEAPSPKKAGHSSTKNSRLKVISHDEEEARAARHSAHEGARDSINFYFNQIKKYSLLTAREEKVLSERVAKGDKEAKDNMIKSNLRLVVNIARRYLNKGFSLEDLIEEGNIGLIKAVERFRATKGCRFSTYATFWIRQTIERAISNKAHAIRLPIHITIDLAKISRASTELMMQLNREPSVAEIAERTGFSGRYVKKLDLVNKKSCSLDAVVPDGSDLSLLDRLEDEKTPSPLDSVLHLNRAKRVQKLMGVLDENEKAIIAMRFGFGKNDPHTLEEIGTSFGITRERVRQIEAKALGKLKEHVKTSDLRSLEMI